MGEVLMDTEVKALEERKSVDTYFKYKTMVYHGIKRTFDICCALAGLLILIPAMIVIKIATMLSGDFHSIFYSLYVLEF